MKRRKRKKLTGPDVAHWLSEIYGLLRSEICQIVMVYPEEIENDFGECEEDYSKDHKIKKVMIRINPYRKEIIDTVIHECLECLLDDQSHEIIYWLTRQLLKRMSPVQYAHLMIEIAHNLTRHYKIS